MHATSINPARDNETHPQLQDMGAARGMAVSAFFDYMHGVHNELALRYVADIAPRNDTLAGENGTVTVAFH